MNFNHRIYGGKKFRPSPEVHFDPDNGLIIIATPWGERSCATKSIQIISDYILSSHNDPELTSPFAIHPNLSPLANYIRASIMLANDSIYGDENDEEYTTALELLIVAIHQNEINIGRVGHPNVFIKSANNPIQPVCCHLDLAHNLNQKSNSPLPSEFIGVHTTSKSSIQTIRANPGDSLIFSSNSSTPASFYLNSSDNLLSQLTDILVTNDAEDPFWIGVLDV